MYQFFSKGLKNNVEMGIFQVLIETRKPDAHHIKMRVKSLIYIQKNVEWKSASEKTH